jgi:hypothetical protein
MHRPLSFLGIAFMLAATAAAQCHVTFQQPGETRKLVSVPWTGNTGEVQWNSTNADCKADKSAPWVAISVMPPTTASAAAPGVLRYSIDTNFTPTERKALVQLGDATVEFTQFPGPRPGMAISPGKIEMKFSPAENAPKEITKPLYVASEEPLPFTARMVESVDWVNIKAANPGAQRQQTFMVTVKTDQLKPGSNVASIEIDAPGAANAREIIPLIVQVGPPPAAVPPPPPAPAK